MTTRDDRAALVRWIACGGLVLAAHAFGLAALCREVEEPAEGAGAPVAFIELAPMAAAPSAAPSDLAPGPPRADSEASASDAQAPPPAETKVPAPDPSPAETKVPAPDPSPLQAPQNDSAAALAAPPSPTPVETPTPPPRAAADPPSDAVVPAAPPSAAEIAPNAAGPEPGRAEQAVSPRTLHWRRALVAQIERFKRYPRRAEGQFGVARVAFTIDRQGRLLDIRIVGGSGSPALDEEALATVRRAEPFPAPPANVPSEALSLVLPIRYAPSRP